MTSEALKNNGWSNVITGEIVCLSARLQMYVSVERMQVWSPGYISIMGRKCTFD